MQYFVNKNSIVREIWGKGDTVLIIFAGASAEFALSKAVDWLYFTGKLPNDPLGRLFSTVEYARKIVFADLVSANKAIDTITAIHKGVESKRGATIPDWAYRDVLFMLIDYSIRSYELMETKLTCAEKQEVFDVFNRVGIRMGLTGLPENYESWTLMRKEHLNSNLLKSHYTVDLYSQYKKHLGAVRYKLLLETQKLVLPKKVSLALGLGKYSWLSPLIKVYQLLQIISLDQFLKNLILPKKYLKEIQSLDRV